MTIDSIVTSWAEGPMLGFDLETTSADPADALPVQLALIWADAKEISQAEIHLVDPGCPIPAEASAIHHITAETIQRADHLDVSEALALVSAALVDASAQGVPVVGMNLRYDLTIVDRLLRAMPPGTCPGAGGGLRSSGWSGPVLDVLCIDRGCDRFRKGKRTLIDLCRHYDVTAEGAHDAAGDVVMSLAVARRLAEAFPTVGAEGLKQLYDKQVEWHATWARGYSSWRTSNGQAPLSFDERQWPLAEIGVEPF